MMPQFFFFICGWMFFEFFQKYGKIKVWPQNPVFFYKKNSQAGDRKNVFFKENTAAEYFCLKKKKVFGTIFANEVIFIK